MFRNSGDLSTNSHKRAVGGGLEGVTNKLECSLNRLLGLPARLKNWYYSKIQPCRKRRERGEDANGIGNDLIE